MPVPEALRGLSAQMPVDLCGLAPALLVPYASAFTCAAEAPSMSLVKKSALGTRGARTKMVDAASSPAPTPIPRKALSKRPANAIDRLEQATQELAGGISEAAAAASELQTAVDQISSGAEEAAGAAQESLGLIGNLRTSFREARERAATSQRQTEILQSDFTDAAGQIDASVAAISLNARRQLASVATVERLETAVTNIVGVGQTVGDLSEQTSMLALNASIEAARAGDSGKGFAIVADEVRELAETAEKSANDIQTLATEIVEEIRKVATRIAAASDLADAEAADGAVIVDSLKNAREDLSLLISISQEIASASVEADAAATEAEKGSEQVASAAEEQSSAAAEAQQAIQQQAASLDQSQQTSEALGNLTTQLGGEGSGTQAAGEIAAAAEELSATVQELSGAASEIQVAIEQISRGAQIQSAATLQSSAALAQIEKSASLAQSRALAASDRVDILVEGVAKNRAGIGKLVEGVGSAIGETRSVLEQLSAIGDTGRRIEKISDSLALVALQTNMLAVSGAVEATRAGDAGAGFATVTADIRKLARAAAANAEESKDVVRSIQDELASVRRDLEQIVAAGEGEAARNQATIDRFQAMAAALGETQAANQAIVEGAEAALRSASEIKVGTEQIATAAELAAGAAREAGVASRQQAQGAEDLAAAIEDIAALAASLVSAVE